MLFPAQRANNLFTHMRERVLGCGDIVGICHVLTKAPMENTGSENGGVFPDCVDDYQRVNHYFSVQTCHFLVNMDDVFKHTTEF